MLDEKTIIADYKNMVFMATNIICGRGIAFVTSTGMETEIGQVTKILQTTEKKPTLVRCAVVFVA